MLLDVRVWVAGKKRGSPERTLRGRSSLLIFQHAHGILSELAPACSLAVSPYEWGLPGFVGPVPPPLLIRARDYSIFRAPPPGWRLGQIGANYTRKITGGGQRVSYQCLVVSHQRRVRGLLSVRQA